MVHGQSHVILLQGDADGAERVGQPGVGRAEPPGEFEVPGAEPDREQVGEVGVPDGADRLEPAACLAEPAPVAHQPDPPADLAGAPPAAEGHHHDGGLEEERSRGSEEEEGSFS